jgi:hypothetical protein
MRRLYGCEADREVTGVQENEGEQNDAKPEWSLAAFLL